LLARRVATQPLGEPNAGSVFRNPEGAYAAQLIEGCGLKGEREGGAEVSRKHANFIVNRGGATALDIETLIYRVQSRVLQDKGVALMTEVQIVGSNA
jgi:UDP-N-acetylmuramate dehydrogenase